MRHFLVIHRWALPLAAVWAAILPMTVWADATARANATTSANPQAPQNPLVHGAVEANSIATVAAAGTATAYANLSTGVLRDSGASVHLASGDTESAANSTISDTITFSGGVGLTAYLDYSFDGNLQVLGGNNSNNSSAFGQLMAYVATVANSTTRYETLSAFANTCGANTNCEVGTATARIGTLAFQIYAGPTFLQMSLSGHASNGNVFDFGNTAKFYLRLPDGVSYTSTSGSFLTSASPIVAVPEPSTEAMLVAGLVVMAGLGRRRTNPRTLLVD